MKYTIHQGDNRDTLKTLKDNSIDAIVTDPPYGIDFLGKAWDANTGALETYRECLRVLKPGGYILAFSAARTYHHLAVTLEQAGFEIRDQLMWLYASGFPKAQDIGKAIEKREGKRHTLENTTDVRPDYSHAPKGYCGRCGKSENGTNMKKCVDDACPYKDYNKQANNEWAGWKTALKPSHEPICMARKPFKGSTIDNVLEHGVGALNIDATRISNIDKIAEPKRGKGVFKEQECGWNNDDYNGDYVPNEQGRFPSNVIGEVEGYQKFFYCPKVSRKERHIGFDLSTTDSVKSMLEDMNGYFIDKLGKPVNYEDRNDHSQVFLPHLGPIYIHGLKHEYEKWCINKKDGIPTEQSMLDDMGGYYCDSNGNRQENAGKVVKLPHLSGTIQIHGLKEEYRKWCEANGKTVNVGNNHPTVKPVALMSYLIKLVTPPNSTVLDPFTGSGSTGMAAVELGHTFIGCELDPNYVDIAKKRIEAWNTIETDNNFKELFDEIL